MTRKDFLSKTHRVHSEPYQVVFARDSKKDPVKELQDAVASAVKQADISAKIDKILNLLQQLVKSNSSKPKAAPKPVKRADATPLADRLRRFDEMCEQSEAAYNERNPHQKDNALSIPVENDDGKTETPALPMRRIKDAFPSRAMSYAQVCEQAQRAYAARNPHKANRRG